MFNCYVRMQSIIKTDITYLSTYITYITGQLDIGFKVKACSLFTDIMVRHHGVNGNIVLHKSNAEQLRTNWGWSLRRDRKSVRAVLPFWHTRDKEGCSGAHSTSTSSLQARQKQQAAFPPHIVKKKSLASKNFNPGSRVKSCRQRETSPRDVVMRNA